MYRRLDPVTGLMVMDGESVPSQVRNSITADLAEVNNKIQVFYPLGAAGTVPTSTGSGTIEWIVSGSGDVVGPASATDNALARFDGTTGKLIQSSTATLSDAGALAVTDATVSGTLTAAHIHGNLAGAVYTHVRNESGGPLAKGTPVYVTGYSVGQARPLVAAANAASVSTMPAIGILDEELANNASGHCVISGGIEDINTAAYSVNAPLYVASGGGLTATAPSTLAQPIAIVERVNANNGSIIVTPAATNGSLANQSAASVAITGGTIFGLGTAGASALTTIGDVSFTGSTASTSTTSGALVVSGGVGIGGSVNIGGNLTAAGTVSLTSATAGAVSTSADITVNGVTVGRGNSTQPTNTTFGNGAMATSTTGGNNVAVGYQALDAGGTGTQNVAVGSGSLGANTSGSQNTAVGYQAMLTPSTVSQNTAIGGEALYVAVIGGSNTAIGYRAARYFGSGTSNHTSATNSIFIGVQSRPLGNAQTNQVVIGGVNALGDGSDTTVIGTSSTTQSRLFGGNAFTTGSSGQSTQLGQATTASPTPTTSGATVTVAALIPANSLVIGVTARVTTAITGATSFDIGDGTTANIFGDDVAVALNTTSANTIAPTRYGAATNIVLTANGASFSGGAVRLTVHFLTLVAPTS